MYVKVQLLLLELMYDSSIAGPPFSFETFPVCFSWQFRSTVIFHRALRHNDLFRSILSIHSLSLFNQFCWHCFSAFFLHPSFSLCFSLCVFGGHAIFGKNSPTLRTDGKSLRLAFNNWVGNFQLLIFIVSFVFIFCSYVLCTLYTSHCPW